MAVEVAGHSAPQRPLEGPTMNRFFQTDDSVHGLVLRLTAGALILPHGLQKIGFLGGYGFEGTMGFFGSIGIPYPVGVLVILAETVGAVLLMTGALTRLWAPLLAATMIGAAWTLHLPNGFFMNWNGTAAGEGIEYNLALLAITGLLAVFGAGRYSVDAWVAKSLQAPVRETVRLREAA